MRQLTRRQRVAAIVLAVIALCFITLDLGGGGLRDAHDGVRGTLGSLYRGTDAVIGPARRWVEGLPSAGTNEGRIEQLQKQNADLRGKLDAAGSDTRTDADVAKLQRTADGTNHTLLPARVIALGPGQGFDWTIIVDAGSRGGVRAGQTVTDGAGLVGRVLHADPDSAVVLLAADPGSGVGVRDARNGEVGVATGAGTDGFVFVPLKPDASVKVGDRLGTGPTGSTRYVAGMSVGTVTAVRTSADGTVRATVRPAAAPTTVDLVAVVLDGGTSDAGRSPLRPAGGR